MPGFHGLVTELVVSKESESWLSPLEISRNMLQCNSVHVYPEVIPIVLSGAYSQ